MMVQLANLELEATVVGIVCVIFMGLMVVAGIKQHMRSDNE